MDCQRADTFFEHEAAGALSPEDRAALDAHLAVCARCQAGVALMKRIDHALREVPPQAAPADLRRKINEALVAAIPEPTFPWKSLFLAAAGSAGLAFGAYAYLTRYPLSPVSPESVKSTLGSLQLILSVSGVEQLIAETPTTTLCIFVLAATLAAGYLRDLLFSH